MRTPSRGFRRTDVIVMVGLAVFGVGCSGDGPASPGDNEAPGTLVVNIQTTGDPIDADGYTLSVNSGTAAPLAVNATQSFQVSAGTSNVVLGDVSVECSSATGTREVGGTIGFSVQVAAGGTENLSVNLSCQAKDIVYIRAHSEGLDHELHRIGVDGSGSVPLKVASFFWTPSWSPDGTKIAYVEDAGEGRVSEIYVMNADGTGDRVICCGVGTGLQFDQSPTWSPDGQSIAWAASRSDETERGIWKMNPDGTNRVQLTDQDDAGPDWGPDGRIVFGRFTDPNADKPWDLYIMDGDGGNQTLLQAAVSRGSSSPQWSPDGQTILFSASAEPSGPTKLWSISPNGGAPVQRTGETREAAPGWSPDGSSIVFEYWGDYPWPPNAHGLCVGAPAGTTCTRITTNSGRGFFDIDPDWR